MASENVYRMFSNRMADYSQDEKGKHNEAIINHKKIVIANVCIVEDFHRMQKDVQVMVGCSQEAQ